jgi:hypothetical protein
METELERVSLVSKLPQGLALRSPSIIEMLAEPPISPWVDAREGSPQWHLREAATAIRAGRPAVAERNLQRVLEVLSSLSNIEQADYWRQCGMLAFHRGNSTSARDHFGRACELASNTRRHLAAWAEAELRLSYETKDDSRPPDVLARLEGSDTAILAMRARVLAGLGETAEAITTAESISGVERACTLAIVLMAGGDRLHAVRALALDKLGRSGEAQSVLEV